MLKEIFKLNNREGAEADAASASIANVAIGDDALSANTAGSYNNAVGDNALSANTTGNANSAVGYHAISSNTTGNANSALGVNAISSNTTGSSNSALGVHALYSNTTGGNNIAMGYAALFSNTTGSSNSAVGAYAGWYYGPDGSNPITYVNDCNVIGANARFSADCVTNETIIGSGAVGSGSNTSTIGSASNTDVYLNGRMRSTGPVMPPAYGSPSAAPAAASSPNGLAIITSTAGHATLCISDGSNWLAVAELTTLSAIV